MSGTQTVAVDRLLYGPWSV